jgi:hypothetical protein
MIGKSNAAWFSAWKWRIILSVTSVLLTIGMSPWFYHGLLANSPNLYFVLNSLNTIPGQLLNMTFQYQLPHLYWTKGYWPRFLFWEYELMVFLFWWWVGWKVDLKAAARDLGRAWTIAEAVVGLGLSLLLFHRRTMGRSYPYPDADHWVVSGWSVFLLCYSLLRLAQLRATSRRLAR